MECSVTADPTAFRAVVAPLLERDPVRLNLVAGVGSSLPGRRDPGPIWMLLSEGGVPVAGAIHVPGRALLVSAPPPELAACAGRVLAAEPALWQRSVPRVQATPATALAYAEAWADRTGGSFAEALRIGLHELTELEPPAGVPGVAAAATPADAGLLTEWLTAFHTEIHSHPPSDLASVVALATAQDRYRLWWEAGRPVALAGLHLPLAGVCRIGPVFTPPEHRGRGFAAAVTAAATRAAQQRGGRRCILFTDLANPVSNRVYHRLGYRQRDTALELWLRPPAEG